MERSLCFPVFSRKNKKSEKISRKTLDIAPENSILGLTLEREAGRRHATGTEARAAAGKIEGIGDVLSDGPRS